MDSILFVISILLLSVILGMFVFLCKKKVISFVINYEAKKKELNDIVIDAEEMIKELNKFSEYIADQVDLKNNEMNKNIKAAEEKAMLLQQRVDNLVISSRDIVKKDSINKTEASYTAGVLETQQIDRENKIFDQTNEDEKTMAAVNGESIISNSSAILAYTAHQHNTTLSVPKKKEKVIPLTTKYSEVIKMSQENMSIQEIAKKLNIGKGEVELILDMRR